MIPAMEDVLMMDPPPFRCIWGMTAFMPSHTPVVLTARTLFHVSRSVSRIPFGMKMPALFTRTSIFPYFAMA